MAQIIQTRESQLVRAKDKILVSDGAEATVIEVEAVEVISDTSFKIVFVGGTNVTLPFGAQVTLLGTPLEPALNPPAEG